MIFLILKKYYKNIKIDYKLNNDNKIKINILFINNIYIFFFNYIKKSRYWIIVIIMIFSNI